MTSSNTRSSVLSRLGLDRSNLYFASRWLSLDNKKALELMVPATIYVQDPLVAKQRRRLGLEEIHVSGERNLGAGPTSARIAVVDYDADKDVVYEDERAKWHHSKRRFVFYDNRSPVEIGREHTSRREYRQVNVWAIIQRVLDFYQSPMCLGRPVPWAFQGNRLVVVPAAGFLENAFYDRHSKSLQFYYCGSERDRVYTSLSHDIVAHETGHAVLDGIRPYYLQNSSIQTAGFHEFIADLTAILSALRNNAVRRVIADTTDGDLGKGTTIADLAEEFAQQMGGDSAVHGQGSRYFLRSALNKLEMKDIENELSPHRCSNVLTGAVFSIMRGVVDMHMAKNVPGKARKVSPRTAFWWATLGITRVALQALDWLPPVDVQFIDYARAVLAAQHQADPLDKDDYTPIMTQAFQDRGLGDSLHPASCDRPNLYRFEVDLVAGSSQAAYGFLDENRRVLCIPPGQDIFVSDLYTTSKLTEEFQRLPREIVIQYVWQEDVRLEGARFGRLNGRWIPLLCGGTLVFDGRGNLLHWAHKAGTSNLPKGPGKTPEYRLQEQARGVARRDRLLDYVARLVAAGRIGIAEGVEVSPSVLSPSVAAREVDGRLRLEVPPHMRHHEEL